MRVNGERKQQRQWVRTVLAALPMLWTIAPNQSSSAQTPVSQACGADEVQEKIQQLPDPQMRSAAERGLLACGELAVQRLTYALNESDPRLRLAAAQMLGQMGQDAQAAVPALVAASRDESDLSVRSSAIQAVMAIGRASLQQANGLQGWQIQEVQALQDLKQQLDELLIVLEKEKKTWPTKAAERDELRRVRNGLQNLLDELTGQPIYQVLSAAKQQPWMMAAAGLGLVLVSGYGGVFLFRPLWLLKFGEAQTQSIAKLPQVGPVLSGLLQGLSPLKYHPYVLNAWVNQQQSIAIKNFTSRYTVADRAVYIPLPVKWGMPTEEAAEIEFTPEWLQPIVKRSRFCMLITGEGGAGKTSLACRIARWGLDKKLAKHPILPILIEQELAEEETLLQAVQGQLKLLIAAEEPVDPGLVTALLRKRRLWVIVDHLSELSEKTRSKIRPIDPAFPINALIITSRLPESIDSIRLEPLRVEGSRLSEFMNAYLVAKQKRHLFEDEDYFEACRRLSRMVGQRNITVLLAKLYIDQMIEQQGGAGGTLPDSVPELMRSYLNQLNRVIEPENRQDDLQVQKEMQVIAWNCLAQSYQPRAVEKAAVIEALVIQAVGQNAKADDQAKAKQNAAACLNYLENRLRLLQTLEPGDKLRIVLDPLAEYLAANYIVDVYAAQPDSEAVWQQFLVSIEQKLPQTDQAEAIQGFLLAVHDCCLVKQKQAGIPDSVPEALVRLAGLNPADLQRQQEKRRIRLLISELSAPELNYRIRAAEDLGRFGAAACIAIPNLLGMLENRNQTTEARQAAARALAQLGAQDQSGAQGQSGAETVTTHFLRLLTDATEELPVRRSIAEAFGLIKTGRTALLNILEDDRELLPLRQGAARAIDLIDASSDRPVPMLVLEPQAVVKAIPVRRQPITESLRLDLVAIPGGEFLMGSPAAEDTRDWYPYNFPETAGLDVEKQHPVTIAPFEMSRFPITQAQWQAVAALPQIDRSLNPDPANFKGPDRPVESVTWYEAIEFCARLSQQTGQTCRLPSEAEWEYACRAGTITPFHFGETLAVESANYDATYAYGNGAIGIYRQQTTPVGSFGVVNGFGLAEMHGNVAEWCLDHWHSTYEDAPVDGTAWVEGGDDRYRMLRGGAWNTHPAYCRSAYRYRYSPSYRYFTVGFRVVFVSP